MMDIEAELDPEVAAFLSNSPVGALDFGSLEFSDLPALREAMATMPRPELPPTRTVYRDQAVPGPEGDPDVTLRIYTADEPSPGRPCLYWIHGGGYMFGTALTDDGRLNRWTEELDCVVVSVEYRLAPESPYPAPLEDCYAGLQWTTAHAPDLGIDPGRLVIGGASAGGGLAAGLALLARDRGEVAIAHQLLIYPMIDDRHANVSSGFAAPIWDKDANVLGWRAYLGSLAGSDEVPIYAAPARAKDLGGLPPATIVVGTIDVFRDEDIDYAARLLGDGVSTELHVYPGAPHGFEMLAATTAVALRCQRDLDDALQRAFRPRNTEPAAGSR
jgi:acetyl esterase/lipase